MTRAAQPECQLGDGLLRNELVDAKSDLVAAEAGQFREQRCRIDLEHELAGATADHLHVGSLRCREDLVQGFVVAAPLLASSCLTQDVRKKVTGGPGTERPWLLGRPADRAGRIPARHPGRVAMRIGHHPQAPLIGITT